MSFPYPFDRFWRNLAWLSILAFKGRPTVKISNFWIIPNDGDSSHTDEVEKCYISKKTDRSSQNLAWRCRKGLINHWPLKIWTFKNSKCGPAGMLKPVKLRNSTIFEPLNNWIKFNTMKHVDAQRLRYPMVLNSTWHALLVLTFWGMRQF